jgi:hypothetical protein
MSGFFKTLFGDAATMTAVAVVMAAEVALVAADRTALAAFAIPVVVLGGIAWLAGR